jgi:hypothetical protein
VTASRAHRGASEEVAIGAGTRGASMCSVQVLLYRFNTVRRRAWSLALILHSTFNRHQSAPHVENNRPRMWARIVHGAQTAEQRLGKSLRRRLD